MNIRLNGEPFAIAEGTTIADLLAQLGYANKRIAVERNEDIVPRSSHPTTLLAAGDRIEIVHAIGGG